MATMARNPSTTMTAIAQWGKPEPLLAFCKLPVCADVDAVKLAVREDREARDADARETDATDAADAEEAAAADDDDDCMEARIESAYVVSVSEGGQQRAKVTQMGYSRTAVKIL